MKRPLPAVAGFYLGGILLADCLPAPLSWLFALSLGVVLLALVLAQARALLLGPLLLLAGATNLALNTGVLSPFDLRSLADERTEYVSLRGLSTRHPASESA